MVLDTPFFLPKQVEAPPDLIAAFLPFPEGLLRYGRRCVLPVLLLFIFPKCFFGSFEIVLAILEDACDSAARIITEFTFHHQRRLLLQPMSAPLFKLICERHWPVTVRLLGHYGVDDHALEISTAD